VAFDDFAHGGDPWFETDTLPAVRSRVSEILDDL
jgi:hypothetical protein